MKRIERLARGGYGRVGLRQTTVFEQDPELVAAHARESVAFAYDIFQYPRGVLQQFVAGHMTAGVVDDFELVDIEDRERVLA